MSLQFLLISIPDFSSTQVWMSLVTLSFLEIVLGIDNIIFISIAADKLEKKQRKLATNVGLILAMFLRIVLLFGISWLIAMNEPWLSFENALMVGAFSGQSIILLLGGIFLLYKSVTEIHHKLEGASHHQSGSSVKQSLRNVIIQITIINIIFSFDSILTAVGMTSGLDGALFIMILAVVLSVLIMMLFANAVGQFIHEHPTLQMLGLSFLILIGFMLILEACHLAGLEIAGAEVGSIPKGYLYFAIAFSVGVEFLNIRLRKKEKPVELHGIQEEAVDKGLLKN